MVIATGLRKKKIKKKSHGKTKRQVPRYRISIKYSKRNHKKKKKKVQQRSNALPQFKSAFGKGKLA